MKVKRSVLAPAGLLGVAASLVAGVDTPKEASSDVREAMPVAIGAAGPEEPSESPSGYSESESPEMNSAYQVALRSIGVNHVVELLESRYSHIFGGISFGPAADASTPVLRVALVNPSASERSDLERRITRHAGRGRIEITSVKYTRDELLAFQDQLGAYVDSWRSSHGDSDFFASMSPDYGRNIIVVEASPDLAEELQESHDADSGSVPSEAWRVVSTDASVQPTDSRHTFPPYKAGREIKDVGAAAYGGAGTRNYRCTAGFVVTIQGGNLAGQNMGTTAGHCSHDGTAIRTGWNGSSYSKGIGTSYYNVFSPNSSVDVAVDAVMMSMEQSAATNDLYVNSTLTRDVTSVAAASGLVVGAANVCTSGATSGVTCGGISHSFPRALYYQYTHPQTGAVIGKRVLRLACSYAAVAGGDSGGPVYRTTSNSSPYTAEAVGLISAAVVTTSGSFLHHCFSPQSEVERYTGTATLLK